MPSAPAAPVRATVWYLGVQIVDPKTPAATFGVQKVPGYNPEPDFEMLKKQQVQMAQGAVPESKVIQTFLGLSLEKRDALQDFFMMKTGRAVSSYFEPGMLSSSVNGILRALAIGPLMYDVELLNKSLEGFGTDEMLLTELVLNRPPEELRLLMEAYKTRYGRNLVDAVKSDLSGDLKRLFVMALNCQRAPDSVPVNQAQVILDVDRLVKAGKAKHEMPFIEIFVNSSRPHLASVITVYGQKHKSLSKVVKKTFSGALENALLYILHGVKAKRDGQGIWRDAKLLEKTMAGLGTRDATLIYRTIRAHWDIRRFERVKESYKNRYGKTLEHRIKGETSGEYRQALLMIVRKQA